MIGDPSSFFILTVLICGFILLYLAEEGKEHLPVLSLSRDPTKPFQDTLPCVKEHFKRSIVFTSNTISEQVLAMWVVTIAFMIFLLGLCSDFSFAWKDEWIKKFEKNALQETMVDLARSPSCAPSILEPNCTWRLPRYTPIRKENSTHQAIPRIIFQTWETYTASGPNQFRAAKSFVNDNPDYEHYIFDSNARLDFIRTFHPDQAELYGILLPGAMQADIWRLAVIRRYGGVYVDIDSFSRTPFSQFVWPNASLVTGVGTLGDFHQWVLMYSPNHPIINHALQTVWHRVRALHRDRIGGSVAQTTGPVAFMAAIKSTLYANKCSFSKNTIRNNSSGVLVHYLPFHFCSKSVGVMQIYNKDYLGGNIVFKDINADSEMRQKIAHYSVAQKHYKMLFKADSEVSSQDGSRKRERSGVKRNQPSVGYGRNKLR